MLKLDLVQTVAFAGLVLFAGYGVRRLVRPLARNNVPAPVVGGLLAAVLITLARRGGAGVVQFDTALQAPLMIAFFTTIGFGASVPLLRRGGPQVILVLGVATVIAAAQNALGMLLAAPLGVHPLIGVLAGSVTLAGGPATGLAFAPDFEAVGVPAAATVAVASAMVGIITAGLVGGPIATWLIERNRLARPRPEPVRGEPPIAAPVDSARDGLPAPAPQRVHEDASDTVPASAQLGFDPLVVAPTPSPPAEEQARDGVSAGETGWDAYVLLKSVVAILAAMWVGSWLSQGMAAAGIKLPAYIGAMLVAAILRNVDEPTGWIGLSQRSIQAVGAVALALFITMALMTLKLWELAGVAVPLLVILAAQVAMMVGVCLAVFRIMGRDYEAAVMTGGFCGFMLGTTANAVANMEALVERYGPAPRAFLVVPMVGAFFIDFTNALIITTLVNFWR
ncbi:MAG: sodium/glutamate symporter [Longimicrobiaceae bacterium]